MYVFFIYWKPLQNIQKIWPTGGPPAPWIRNCLSSNEGRLLLNGFCSAEFIPIVCRVSFLVLVLKDVKIIVGKWILETTHPHKSPIHDFPDGRGGGYQAHSWGWKYIILQIFFQKLHENDRNWTERGGGDARISSTPLPHLDPSRHKCTDSWRTFFGLVLLEYFRLHHLKQVI